MKICAVICEYNPFHTGHLYQIKKVPAKYDKIICVMSGNFVQRAEPALIDKRLRAEIALNSGVDMVIENPVINAVANGEKFAEGAVKAISQLPYVSGLIMGCETDKPDLLEKIADQQISGDGIFNQVFTNAIGSGQSYAASYCSATALAMKEKGYDESVIKEILNQPNNLLCIEYIKSIRKYRPEVEPIIVRRKGNGYNSSFTSGDYLSATAIRNILLSDSPSDASPYLPEYDKVKEIFSRGKFADYSIYDSISLFNLRSASKELISGLYDCSEGLEFSLYDNARSCETLQEVLKNVKSKRYTFARLKRIILQLNLGITKDVMNNYLDKTLPFHVLAIKNDFKSYLSVIEKNAVIRNSDYGKFSDYGALFDIEKRASALYSTVTRSRDSYYSEQLITDKLI